MDKKFNIVVVPDGLAVGKNGNPINEPSMVFRAVLNHVAKKYNSNNIYIAPANTFGKSEREEIVAKLYLEKKGCSTVIAPNFCKKKKSYIDTLGNAILLASYLKSNNSWPLNNSVLIVAKRHSKRASLCFSSQGFKFVKIESVEYRIRKKDKVVKRLFYYKFPSIHKIYEFLAYLRDVMRIYFIRRFKWQFI